MTHTQNKNEIEEFPSDWLVTGGQGDFSQMRDGYMLEMKPNRMWRPFLGGKMLDELSEIVPATDGHYPGKMDLFYNSSIRWNGNFDNTEWKTFNRIRGKTTSGTRKAVGQFFTSDDTGTPG